MKHYDSIPNIKDDGTLLGKDIWAFNKLDGQNFCVSYIPKTGEFRNFGSKTQMVDETSDQFGDAVKYFKSSNFPRVLPRIVKENSGKRGIFNGIQEITFFFEWYGENSFAGRHEEGDSLRLSLIDVFLKKKGYLEPGDFYKLFVEPRELDNPELIYHGKLTKDFIRDIWENRVGDSEAMFPEVKEGVVCKNTSLLKGQRLPKAKFKTKWWINKLHSTYPEEEWKKLE